jgi:ankyrin repeat protein
MVQQLLDAGADPQHQESQGKTALELMPMHAVRRVLTAVTREV